MPAAGILAGKGANVGNLFYTTPKVLKLHETTFLILQEFMSKRNRPGGPHPVQETGDAPPPYRACPAISWAPWWASGVHLLLYHHFYPGKNHGQAYGTKLRRHEAEPWRNQSRALAELFCRGHFPPGGGNHHQRHHQRSSHREGVNLHQHLHQHHLLSNPSSSLVSNSCL